MPIDEKNVASRDYTRTLVEATAKNIEEKIKKSDWN